MRRGLLAAVSLLLVGAGLWLAAGGFVTGESSDTQENGRAKEQADRFAESLAANNADDVYSFFGRDLRSLFGPDELKEQWRTVEAARVVQEPEVDGDWAEFVVELSSGNEAKPSLYLVVFHWEAGGWKLFATEERSSDNPRSCLCLNPGIRRGKLFC